MTSRLAVRPMGILAIAAVLALFSSPLVATAATVSTGSISGTVHRPGGAPVAGVVVDLYQQHTSDEVYYVGSVQTSANGGFVIKALPPGSYRVGFTPPKDGPNDDLAMEYFEDEHDLDSARHISVRSGAVNIVNADLELGGHVTGKVTKPNGQPLAGALIYGYSGDHGSPSVVAESQPDGTYILKGLAVGPQRLSFFGPMEEPSPYDEMSGDYFPEWWQNKTSRNASDPVDIVGGQTSTGKDAQLRLRGTPVTNLTLPSITGSPEVGEPLQGHPGTWSPDGNYMTYTWYVNGVASTSQSDTFVPSLSDVGKTIKLKITIWGSETSAMSAATSPVTSGGPLHNTAKPELREAERVGDDLSIRSGEWTADVQRTHQLLADGVAIPGATMSGFDITPDLVGKRLSVRETATMPGRATTSVTSEETAPIELGLITIFGPPKINGAPIVGLPITATDGQWNLTGDRRQVEEFTYKWRSNNAEIPGANQATFTPTSAEAGKALTVEVTAKREGYVSGVSNSEPSDPVAEFGALRANPGHFEIHGTPVVGRELCTTIGDGWAPNDVTTTDQWRADGVPIAGASERCFTITSSQAGKALTAERTASRVGYTSGSVVSENSLTVLSSTPFGAPAGLHATSRSVTTIDLAWTKVDGAAKYRIYYGIGSGERTKVEVGNVTKATLKGLKPGTEYSIDIAALKSSGTRSDYSPRIAAKTMQMAKPTGLAVTGRTPSSVTLTWTKVPGVTKYRIYHGIGTGTRTKTDVGDVSTKTITGLKPGTTYSIDIASLLSDGTRSDYSPRINATTTSFLPPTNLASSGVTSTTINMNWTKSPGAVKYRLYYGIGTGSRTKIEVGDVSGLTIKKLKSKTTYSIDVSAFTADGTQSAYTPRISVKTS